MAVVEGLDFRALVRSCRMDDSSLKYLKRWHGGDEAALEALIRCHRPWVRSFVRQRLGDHLRGVHDSEDVVQEVLASLFRSGPAFLPENEAQFRALIARIVQNCICNLSDHLTAARRDRRRTSPIDSVAISVIGSSRAPTRPDEHAARTEEEGHLRLAMELIEPDDKEILVMRDWESSSFRTIACELSIDEKSATRRYHRAVARLGRMTRKLQAGDLDDLIGEARSGLGDAKGDR